MKYQMVTAKDPSMLNELINRRLKEGWEPYGSPFPFVTNPATDTFFCQAMIFREGSDE